MGDKAHGQVTGLNVIPSAPVAGDNVTLTLTATNDKTITAMKGFLRFEASLIHHAFDGCVGATILTPTLTNEPTIIMAPPLLGCPQSATPIAKFTRYMATSKRSPLITMSHVEIVDQDNEPFL